MKRAEDISRGWCFCPKCREGNIRDIQLDAINAAADLVRDTKEDGAEELATAIVETLTRAMQ